MFWKRSSARKVQAQTVRESSSRTLNVETRKKQEQSTDGSETDVQTLYVLKCEDSCWYVGISGNFEARWRQHHTGRGAAWTKVHKPIRVERTRQVAEEDAKDEERWETAQLMLKYGVNYVRGAALTLSAPYDLRPRHVSLVTNVIYKAVGGNIEEIRERVKEDLGSEEDERETASHDDDSDRESDVDLLGSLLGGISVSGYRDSNKDNDGNCGRCGRNSHVRSECYARTHLNGKRLYS